jgi:hypothetical protein
MVRRIDVSTISVDTPHYDEATRWLTDNGIDPLEVPLDSEMVVTEDAITYDRFPRDESGAYLIDKSGDRLVRESVTVPKKSSPETYGL